MPSYYTSADIIASVKRRIAMPEQQSTFNEEDLLAFANEEMNLGLVPSVLTMHEDYFLYTEKIPLVGNQNNYTIPYRAIGNKLREVSFQDSNGNVFEMTRIGVGDLPYYQNNLATNSNVYAFYVQNNEIVLAPANTNFPGNTYLSVSYYIRPNSLVDVAQVGVISSINTTTGEIQLTNFPTAFNGNQKYDLMMLRSPHKTLKFDISAVSVNSTSKTITLNVSDIPSNLSVGDHIALAEQCCIPQIPSDLHVVLAHRVAARCLEAQGDTEGLQNANAKLAEFEQKTQTLIDNRVEDAPMKLVNRHGFVRSGLSSRNSRRRGF
jgi:hypothetical protein